MCFCSYFAVFVVVAPGFPPFDASPRCVVPPVLLCVSHFHRACGSTWGFCVVFFGVGGVIFIVFGAAAVCCLSSSLLFSYCAVVCCGFGLLGVVCCWCVAACGSCCVLRVLCVSFFFFTWLSGVLGLVRFFVVVFCSGCFAPAVLVGCAVLLLVLFWLVFGVVLLCPVFCSWLSSGGSWW